MEGLIPAVSPLRNGLMPKDGFIDRGTINGPNLDADNITEMGIYWRAYSESDNHKNFPVIQAGYLIVIKTKSVPTNIQFFITYYSFHYRMYSMGKYLDWITLSA